MNNRIIKFRAWDGREMYYNPYIPNHGKWAMLDESIKDCQDNYVAIMQFTGLYDKEGKEIYEGDLLKWKSSNPFSLGEIRTVKVVYTRAWYWCLGIKTNFGCYLDELLTNEKCEVIGNIYSNPELISNTLK